MGKLLKQIHFLIPALLLATLMVVIPQLDNKELMDPTQSGKAFGLLWGMLGYVVIVLFIAAIKREIITIRVTLVDLLLGAYSVLVVIFYWLHPVDHLQMLSFGALILFYLCVRALNGSNQLLFLIAVVISGLIQAIYGNMQLYGLYSSNHGIFRMTGSFFNPGPYAGYLAAVFPVSLGFYLFYDATGISSQHPIVLKLNSFSIRIRAFLKRIPFIAPIFYHNNKEGDTPEKQAERLSCTYCVILKSFGLISMISMCLVQPASRSRAAWLGVLVSAGYLLSIKYQLLSQIRLVFHTRIKRFILFSSLIIILILTGAGLYYFKKDSADGRLLIWKVAANMVAEKPVWGRGTDKFAAEYMNYQAAYFSLNSDVPEAMQADNVTYAYNEFLKITVEKGIIGLLLAFAVIGCLFFLKIDLGENNNSHLTLLGARGGLLSILVFALFSYPSDILPIEMLFVMFVGVVASQQKPICIFQLGKNETIPVPPQKAAFTGTAVLYAALVVALMAVFPAGRILARQYQAYKSWKDASDIYNVGAYKECLEDFELSYPLIKNNGDFLVQYGKALEMAGKYDSSIVILKEAKQHLNNTILYTCLGNNYKSLSNNIEAEQAYMHALNMAPARFYPLYLLAKLYNETGQMEKAVTMAKKVMEKGVKIESTAIKDIKVEMKNILK
ncbi:MAG TPA: O-antigen ligase family protein [Prolixibacteraceae bacterium]|jgi:O-antigen ligase